MAARQVVSRIKINFKDDIFVVFSKEICWLYDAFNLPEVAMILSLTE
jgi:hypothetical protein